PGASNAFAIASRLGLDAGVLAKAETHLSELHRSLERTLREAERQRTELASSLEEARVATADATKVLTQAERDAERVREQAREALRRAKTEADELILRARRALRQAETARDEAAKRNLVDDARAALREAEASREAVAPEPRRPTLVHEIAVGSPVLVDGVSEPGTLVAIDEKGIAEVASGPLRLRVPREQLRPAPRGEVPIRSSRTVVHGAAANVPLQLDIRGARAEEALSELDRYLNNAAVAGYDRVRIVHGKGTGALRNAVREALSSHPLVRGQSPAGANEGGDGATIVTL
ncbi:MAG TPA: Smr/MutS family protein, partial [Candidatus Limnocylindria bacterium]|nr:Smr/MutS family protein [Candidatus Limnocylindria bacterium]